MVSNKKAQTDMTWNKIIKWILLLILLSILISLIVAGHENIKDILGGLF